MGERKHFDEYSYSNLPEYCSCQRGEDILVRHRLLLRIGNCDGSSAGSSCGRRRNVRPENSTDTENLEGVVHRTSHGASRSGGWMDAARPPVPNWLQAWFRPLFAGCCAASAKPWRSPKAVVEDLELLGGLPVVSGSQDFVRNFPFVSNHFLQRESVRIQLPRKEQQLFQIQGITRSFLGNLGLSRRKSQRPFHWTLLRQKRQTRHAPRKHLYGKPTAGQIQNSYGTH